MKTWRLKFASYKTPDDIFDMVERGMKTIETRPISPNSTRNYEKIKPGDKLVLISKDSGRMLNKTVKSIAIYKSVKDMIVSEDVNKIFPGIGSAENLEKVFNEAKKKWGAEYKYNLEHYGIVAIHI